MWWLLATVRCNTIHTLCGWATWALISLRCSFALSLSRARSRQPYQECSAALPRQVHHALGDSQLRRRRQAVRARTASHRGLRRPAARVGGAVGACLEGGLVYPRASYSRLGKDGLQRGQQLVLDRVSCACKPFREFFGNSFPCRRRPHFPITFALGCMPAY